MNSRIVSLFAVGVTAILLTIFVRDDSVLNGTIYPKGFYFLITGSVLLMGYGLCMLVRQRAISLDQTDLLIGCSILYLLVSYRTYYDNYPCIILSLLLVIVIKQLQPQYRSVLVVALVVAGLCNALYGIAQFAGILPSWNKDFPLTGAFHNPGPLGVWLTLIFPFCLSAVFHCKRHLKWMAVGITVMIAFVIAVSFSRAAWLGVVTSVLYLLWDRIRTIPILRNRLFRYMLPGVIIVLAMLVFMLKQDSALGRLLIWKISFQMFLDHPLTGIGLNGFERNFGVYLSRYFSMHTGNVNEVLLAERADYLFNDPLQLLVEQGLVGFMLFALMFISAFRSGNVTVRASLLGLGVASLFSYPLELVPVWVTLAFVLALSGSQEQYKLPAFATMSVAVLFIFMCSYTVYAQMNIYKAKKVAYQANERFLEGDVKQAVRLYSEVYPILSYDYRTALLYAKTLNRYGAYEKSNEIIGASEQLICDPYMYITYGDNFKAMAKPDSAKAAYIMASNIEPKLIYPKYLLAKLYLATKDTANAIIFSEAVLQAKVKVKSQAVDEMQAEIFGLLEGVKH